ncbi:MAG: hypothetical protein WKF82_02075 [Nocardioidaceae bacterium]
MNRASDAQGVAAVDVGESGSDRVTSGQRLVMGLLVGGIGVGNPADA